MARRRRVRYSPEFKAEAIRLMRTTETDQDQRKRTKGKEKDKEKRAQRIKIIAARLNLND